MFCYCKRLCNIPEILMLSEVNKVFKDNNLVSSLLYFVPHPPFILTPSPRLIIFQNPWSSLFNLTALFIMSLRVIITWKVLDLKISLKAWSSLAVWESRWLIIITTSLVSSFFTPSAFSFYNLKYQIRRLISYLKVAIKFKIIKLT